MRRTAALLLPLLASCTHFSGDPHVVITSTPAGAEVLLDGQPTGHTTPIRLELGGLFGADHQITLRKAGFEDEVRRVFHYTNGYTSTIYEGATEVEPLRSPVFWTFGDFFLPFAVRWRYVPHELHAVLYAEGMAPVRGDAEAETPSPAADTPDSTAVARQPTSPR